MEGVHHNEAAATPVDQSQPDTVKVLHVSLVKPAIPTIRHSMYMSVLDQLLRTAPPSRTILFYRTNKNPTEALEALRQGLASTLIAFYPLAGRLLEEGSRLALDCNDQGVELIEAHCNLTFAELERDSFQIRPLFGQLVPMDSVKTSDVLDYPLASIQVTAFMGGLTVGIAVLHSVADGHAMWTFIRAIAWVCREEPVSVYPLHARTLLNPEVCMMGTSFSDMPLVDRTRQVDVYRYNDCEATVNAINLASELLKQNVINFSHDMLEALKEACFSSSDHVDEHDPKHGAFISTYQALAAYLWKRLTMAQGLEDGALSDLRVSMDVRTRMIPPLTHAYFGNAIVGVPTPATAGELKRETLGVTAGRIRESIHQGNDMYIKKTIIERANLDTRKVILGPTRMMVIRNATSFPVYEGGDFGWGEPEAVRPPMEGKEGVFTWYPGKRPKSIDVITTLTESTWANFFSPHLYPNDPLHFPHHQP